MSSHQIDSAHWAKLDVFNQMGNIGSEVGRAINAKKRGDSDRMTAAFYRGIDLINETINSWSDKVDNAIPELLIAREQFANSILTDQEDDKLEKYFTDFALVARKGMSG